MRPINLTIVMATYNRADLLRKNIDLLLSSSYAFELLVIDDGSTDRTEKTVRSSATASILPTMAILNH
jgi:glycosyltransferase involved in cell wall biosynthesis